MNKCVMEMLAAELKLKWPDNGNEEDIYSYALDIMVPGSTLRKTVDNNVDALETVMNLRESRGERCSIADLIRELDGEWGDGQAASPRTNFRDSLRSHGVEGDSPAGASLPGAKGFRFVLESS